MTRRWGIEYHPVSYVHSRRFHCAEVIVRYELVRFLFFQVMEYEKTIPFLTHVVEGNLILPSCSHSLSVIPNNSGLSIQSNCNRTEYLCGPFCVRLIVETDRERERE